MAVAKSVWDTDQDSNWWKFYREGSFCHFFVVRWCQFLKDRICTPESKFFPFRVHPFSESKHKFTKFDCYPKMPKKLSTLILLKYKLCHFFCQVLFDWELCACVRWLSTRQDGCLGPVLHSRATNCRFLSTEKYNYQKWYLWRHSS